jgi:hypothetical protein
LRDFTIAPNPPRKSRALVGQPRGPTSRSDGHPTKPSTAAAALSTSPSATTSGDSGASYATPIPGTSCASPRRARAYSPFESRASHTSSGVLTHTSTNPRDPDDGSPVNHAITGLAVIPAAARVVFELVVFELVALAWVVFARVVFARVVFARVEFS